MCSSAESDPNSLRVIGYAHTDDDYYYKLLQYYEPIIYKFVAVSREVGLHLLEYIPFRHKDIIVKPYAVNVSPSLSKVYPPSNHPLRITYEPFSSTAEMHPGFSPSGRTTS